MPWGSLRLEADGTVAGEDASVAWSGAQGMLSRLSPETTRGQGQAALCFTEPGDFAIIAVAALPSNGAANGEILPICSLPLHLSAHAGGEECA